MRAYLFLGLVAVGCASKAPVNKFDYRRDCSLDTVSYLDKVSNLDESKNHELLETLNPAIQSCYKKEMNRWKRSETSNLCLVVSFDKKSKIQFQQFSLMRYQPSKQLRQCLDDVDLKQALGDLKDVTIVQSFRLSL